MIAIWLAAAVATTSAATTVPTPAAVDDYLDELARVEQAKTPRSLEPLLARAEKVQTAVMAIDDEQAWIERLSDDEFARMKTRLRGLVIARGLDVYAQPDPDFMLKLAEAHGRDADRDFFRLYRAYWSPDFVPVFMSLTDRPTPCVRFGEASVQSTYEAWRGYASHHPDAYVDFTKQVQADIEEAVALGTCACGDTASVLKEEEGFLKRFPDTRVAGDIRSRMQQLRDDPDARPVRCR